ncbi:MAG: 30S ribosomal protein S1 [Oscillospiraceae bacterium]|nr:30S ribosomal protein S1 [Oscillospiraceae bacterium]
MLSYRVAEYAGLCVGVERALKAVDDLLGGGLDNKLESKPENRLENKLEGSGAPNIYMWGPIIHNNVVVDAYKARGVRVADCLDGLPTGCTLVFRAHGVAPDVAERARARGITCVDATCAHVRASQRLARRKADEGYQIVIVGDGGHPEVIGINGWAYGTAIAAATFDGLVEQLESGAAGGFGGADCAKGEGGAGSSSGADCANSESGAGSSSSAGGLSGTGGRRLCVMAQTTFNREAYDEICAAVMARYPGAEAHDTICAATSERQAAAGELAKQSDVMIVIGSGGSSNAKQLYSLCLAHCHEAYMIETAGDLPPYRQLRGRRIGITASASTPDWIIEEVITKMEEMKRLDGDIDFAEEMESSLVTLQVGQTVKGRIIRHNSTEVYVDLGYKSDGVIPIEEFVSDSEQDPVNNINIDDVIDVFVVRVNDSEGTVQLSKKRVDEKNNWARIEEAFESTASIKAVVTDVTNGGLIVTSGGVRIFVPASQVSDRYVEDLRGYLRKPVDLRVIDYNKQKRKFVGSMKALIVEEKRRAAEQLWNEIDAGKEYLGTVKSLTAFGAFVDIGGVDGLVHISELSWGRIKHPSDVVKVGEQVSVRVISLDREKKKISLGYRREEDNPWYRIEDRYPVGAIVTKRVVRIAPFGAFVELEKGIDALVHISQISDTRIAKPDDVLRVGMEVTAKITELNLETKKISMSIKEVEPIPYIPPYVEGEQAPEVDDDDLPTEYVQEMRTTLGDALGDMLKSVAISEAEDEEPEAVAEAEAEAEVEVEAEAVAEAAEVIAEAEAVEVAEAAPETEAPEPEELLAVAEAVPEATEEAAAESVPEVIEESIAEATGEEQTAPPALPAEEASQPQSED